MDIKDVRLSGLLKSLADEFSILKQNSTKYAEGWEEIRIEGNYFSALFNSLNVISKLLEQNDCGSLTVDINEGFGFEQLNTSELSEMISDRKVCDSWKLIYSKQRGFNEPGALNHLLFFVDYVEFTQSLLKLNPLTKNNALDFTKPCYVFVNGLNTIFGNHWLQFVPLQSSPQLAEEDKQWSSLPDDSSIKQFVHVVPTSIHINLKYYLPTWGESDDTLPQHFLRKSAQVFAICLVSSMSDSDNVCIRGIKPVNLKFNSASMFTVDNKMLSDLCGLITWVYNEKRETRLKLVRDHLSLELNKDKSFIENCLESSEELLRVCKEEYDFVISDLRTEYEKEKREFLTDLRNIASGYYERVRVMSAGLFRDVIAIAFLLGINLGSELIKNPKVISSSYFPIYLKCISGYLLISLVIQLLINLFEYGKLNKNTEAWAKHTRGYMRKERIDAYISEFTSSARAFWQTAAWVWGVLYIVLAVLLFFSGIYLPDNSSSPKESVKPKLEKVNHAKIKSGLDSSEAKKSSFIDAEKTLKSTDTNK